MDGTVQTHARSFKGLIVISLILSLGSLVLAFCLTVTLKGRTEKKSTVLPAVQDEVNPELALEGNVEKFYL